MLGMPWKESTENATEAHDSRCCSIGIMGAKHTPNLIPMCHTVPLDNVRVDICAKESQEGSHELEITATASATHRTG